MINNTQPNIRWEKNVSLSISSDTINRMYNTGTRLTIPVTFFILTFIKEWGTINIIETV